MPSAVTDREALAPAATVRFCGCAAMVGALELIVTATGAEVARRFPLSMATAVSEYIPTAGELQL